MRRFLLLFILIGTLILPYPLPVTAFADTTTLSTSVPSEVSFWVEIIGPGTVTVNGYSYSQSDNFPVDRHKEVTINFLPKSSSFLKSVYLNGEDVTDQLVDNVLIVENIQFDIVLSATFARNPYWYTGENPATGAGSFPYRALPCAIISLVTLFLVWKYRRKLYNE